jgi:hypothetical protein
MIDSAAETTTALADETSGKIGPMTFPALIQDLCAERHTGVLTLTDGGAEKAIFIEKGRIVFARSNEIEDRLGSLLIRRGLLTLRDLEDASYVSIATGQRLGGVLVSKNIIRSKDLVEGVCDQVKEIVISLFLWTRGSYEMKFGLLPSKEVITLKVRTEDIILEGVRRINAWARIQLAVGGSETHYKVGPRLSELSDSMDLSLEEWTMLARCEGPETLGQLCDVSAMKDFDVCRLIWAFTVVGMLERLD